MKLIIAGSRSIHFGPETINALVNHFKVYSDTIISGCATGIDRCGERWAERRGKTIKRFPADWTQHGKSAGPIRNKQMADFGDELLLIWNGDSRGSGNMKDEMIKLKKPVHEVILK